MSLIRALKNMLGFEANDLDHELVKVESQSRCREFEDNAMFIAHEEAKRTGNFDGFQARELLLKHGQLIIPEKNYCGYCGKDHWEQHLISFSELQKLAHVIDSGQEVGDQTKSHLENCDICRKRLSELYLYDPILAKKRSKPDFSKLKLSSLPNLPPLVD